ncbi:DUF806 family protein [Lactobacillus sp. SL9-6]|nr:DUF806 family protein [Lactobacillus sp. SL9-6]
MELPVVTAKKLIASSNYSWIDELYFSQIPEEADTSGDKTIVLITSVTEPLGRYKNDTPSALEANLQVQIFYGNNFEGSTLDTQLQLINLFINNGWNISGREPNILDPDTNQVTATFTVTCNFTLNFERGN